MQARTTRWTRWLVIAEVLAVASCGDDDTSPPGMDAAIDGSISDASARDAHASLDATTPAPDARGDSSTPPMDAGWDAAALTDAGFDSGLDAGFDGGFDAGRDAGFDAGRDAGFDAGRDAGFDASLPDTGPEGWQFAIAASAAYPYPAGDCGETGDYTADRAVGPWDCVSCLDYCPPGVSGMTPCGWKHGGEGPGELVVTFAAPIRATQVRIWTTDTAPAAGVAVATSAEGPFTDLTGGMAIDAPCATPRGPDDYTLTFTLPGTSVIGAVRVGFWSSMGVDAVGIRQHDAGDFDAGRDAGFDAGHDAGPDAGPSIGGAWRATSSMSAERLAHTATLLASGEVLVTGGQNAGDETVLHASAEIFDPVSETWRSAGVMSSPRSYHCAASLLDGRVLVMGGASDSVQELRSAEIFDPATGAWTSTGSMSVGRNSFACTMLTDGRVLVAGGNGASSTSAELYDPTSGTWTPTGSFSFSRTFDALASGLALLPSGDVLAAGGSDSTAITEVYHHASGLWTMTGSMAHSRFGTGLVPLSDGSVLVAGGYSASHGATLPTCELFDPAAGTWSPAASMLVPRAYASLVRLLDGRVVVAGGRPATGVLFPYESSEVYSPTRNEWRLSAPLDRARWQASATLLRDGRVLLAGGAATEGSYLSSAEIYEPPP